MKTFKYFIAPLLVVIGFAVVIHAEGLKHLVWQTPGTNLVAIASSDATSSVIAIGTTTPNHVRVFATISNTNPATTAAIGAKLGALYGTTATFDVLIPPNGSHTFYFGDGYNGPISVRATNTTALNFIYWEGGY